MKEDHELNKFLSQYSKKGARRFSGIPGVKYAEDVKKETHAPRWDPRARKVVPQGYITTAEAAKIFDCTIAAARTKMMNNKVRHFMVNERAEVPRLYWSLKQVEKIAASHAPILETLPDGMISAGDSARLLNVCRSTLYRYVKKNMLKHFVCRLENPGINPISGKMMRRRFIVHYFRKSDVLHLSKTIKEIKSLESRLEELRMSIRTRLV